MTVLWPNSMASWTRLGLGFRPPLATREAARALATVQYCISRLLGS